MFRHFKRLFPSYAGLGVQEHVESGRIKSIKLVNQLRLLAGFGSLLFVFRHPEIKPPYVKTREFAAPLVLGITLLSVLLLVWVNDRMAIKQGQYVGELKACYLQSFTPPPAVVVATGLD